MLGFAAALRRSELIGLDVAHVTWTRSGLKVLIARSKTDAEGAGAELAIPCGEAAKTCPVRALKTWLKLAEIADGPVFRKINRGEKVGVSRLSPDAVRQILLKRAAQARLRGRMAESVSPHSLRAGFVTTAYRNGVPDEEIMGHTRHRSLTTMRSYRGKRGLTLNFKSAQGQTILERLVDTADVLIENFLPATAARLGLDHATLLDHNPRLIHASITGYGNRGPMRDRPGYDNMADHVDWARR